jgi:hypothetical protein
VKFLGYGEETVVDDDLCLMMIKKLKWSRHLNS